LNLGGIRKKKHLAGGTGGEEWHVQRVITAAPFKKKGRIIEELSEE